MAVERLRRAVESGHGYATALLGAWQTLGYQLRAEPTLGILRLEEAAAAGESAACAFLANLYAGGLQVEQSWTIALDWLLGAARLANERALTQLALLAHGDAPDALRVNLLLAAATRGFVPAQYLLGHELSASPEARHREVARAWLGSAARAGHPSAIGCGGLAFPIARAPFAVSLEGVDWKRVRARCDIARHLSAPRSRLRFESPRIETFEGLIPETFCDYVIGLAAPLLARATVNDVDRGDSVHDMRTNSDMSFSAMNSDVLLQLINQRLALATGLPLSQQETTTVLRYRPGETYREHFDFIDPGVPKFRAELAERGQRVATALVYLSTGYEGGETDFPLLHWRYRGNIGDALAFRNVAYSGEPERRSLHAGLPPVRGEKWLLSKWLRDRPQEPMHRG